VNRFGVRDLEEFRARLSDLRISLNPPNESGAFVAYTDGACFGNPEGPGGWAAAVFPWQGDGQWLLFGHLSSTSNNRAEALGVLGALEWVLPDSTLALHSDSELTIRILQRRYKVKANTDIWDLIHDTIRSKQLDVRPEWVRGHAGDPRNELADRLSKAGALNAPLETSAESIASVPSIPQELVGLSPLNDWERDFVVSIQDQLRRGRSLSPKQQAVLDRMRTRKT
jgi:ribonuclease HI